MSGPGDPIVVVGAGINVDQYRDALPVNTATSLALAGATSVDRSRLCGVSPSSSCMRR